MIKITDESLTKEDLNSLELRVDDRAKEYRDQILGKLDEVMGELENHREEREFIKYDMKNLNARITKLEKTPSKVSQWSHILENQLADLL